jgi:FMN reductase
MSRLNAVAIAGSLTSPSRCSALAALMLDALHGEQTLSSELLEVSHLARDLGQALHRGEASRRLERALEAVERADVLVVVTPVRRGSFPGIFKHFFDLMNPEALRDVPVLLGTTGPSRVPRAQIEAGLLPVLASFAARTVETTLFASERDFDAALQERARVAAKQASALLRPSGLVPSCAPARAL